MSGVKNLGLVKAIWVGTTAPTNTSMIWYDSNSGVMAHKWFKTSTSTWETFIINGAVNPLSKSGVNIILLYDTTQFELTIDGELKIKDNVLSAVTPPFPISDITGLQTALDSKVDKVTGKSLILDTEIARLSTVINYTHPVTHLPSIISQDANNRFVTDVEKSVWNGKQDALGFTPYNETNPDGYITASDLSNLSFLNCYRITLPNAASVAARCSAAVEGVDYPTGWTIEAWSGNPNDLLITHNLGKELVTTTIFYSMSGGSYRLLIGNAAFSGISTDLNGVKIEALATLAFPISINLILV